MLEDGLRSDFPTDVTLLAHDRATLLLALEDMIARDQLTDELFVLRGGLMKEAVD